MSNKNRYEIVFTEANGEDYRVPRGVQYKRFDRYTDAHDQYHRMVNSRYLWFPIVELWDCGGKERKLLLSKKNR